MKKLLSLLSILTISGTAVPTTIAASPYKKEKTLNGGINQQKNNLKTLNRFKRQMITTTNDGSKIIDKKGYIKDVSSMSLIFKKDKFYLSNDIYSISDSKIYKNNNEIDIFTQRYANLSGVVLENNIYFSSPGEGIYKYNNIDNSKKKITNLGVNAIAVLDNKLYFNVPGFNHGVYEYNPKTKETIIVYRTSYLYSLVTDLTVLDNKLYASSEDQSIYEYNKISKNFNYIFSLRGMFIDSISHRDCNVLLLVLNDILYIKVDDQKTYEFLPFSFVDESLLKDWENNFNIWKISFERQKKDNLPTYDLNEKKRWKEDKINELLSYFHYLKQDINIILNKETIKNLKNRINQLSNNIISIENRIDKLQNLINNNLSNNSSNNILTGCSNYGAVFAAISSLIPVIGTVSSAILGLAASVCTIANT